MSLPLLVCKYVTEEFVREGMNGNYDSKLPSSVPMLRFLYELCWILVRGELPVQICTTVLERVNFWDNSSKEEIASCFVDVVTQIAQDVGLSNTFFEDVTVVNKFTGFQMIEHGKALCSGLQEWEGDVTVIMPATLAQYSKIIQNPTHVKLQKAPNQGTRCTWEKLSAMKANCGIELALDECVDVLNHMWRFKRSAERAATGGTSSSHHRLASTTRLNVVRRKNLGISHSPIG